MRFRTLKYHFGQGVRGMAKNGFMSLAAIATVIACSFILILSLCVCMNIDYILKQFEENIGITVFLGPDVSEEMTEDIGNRIKHIDHVTDVVYKSADDNLTSAIESWENASILEGLRDDNPLPSSFEIKLEGAKYQDSVVAELEALQLSIESELNAEPDGTVYLDQNGNQITKEQAAQGNTQAKTEGTQEGTTAAKTAQTTEKPSAPATEVVTSAAQADAAVSAQNKQAEAEPAPPPEISQQSAPNQQPAQSAQPAAAEAPQQETIQTDPNAAAVMPEETKEDVVYSSAPSQDLMNTIMSAVSATAGGGIYYEPSSMSSTDAGVAGTDLYDAKLYGTDGYEYKGIEKIRHATEESHMLVRINTAVRIFSVIIMIILCIISISIIMNTIRLTVVIRKNEINIMKYVGATDWFIRWPFIIEGMLMGFIGSFISTVICFFGYTECLHLLSEKLTVIANIAQFIGPFEIFAYIAPIALLFGVLLGIIGSVSSIRKYLRV